MKSKRQFLNDFVARILASDCKADVTDYFRAVFVHFEARTQEFYLDFYTTTQLKDLPALLDQAITDNRKREQLKASIPPLTREEKRMRMYRINNRHPHCRSFTSMSDYARYHKA